MGIGNRLLMDDGVGSCLAEVLSELELPDWLEVVDGGIGGLSLIDYMEGKDVLFVIDALVDESPAGTVKLFTVDLKDIDPSESIRLLIESGSHGVVPEVLLAAAKALGKLPPVSYVVGIVPEKIELGDNISEPALVGATKAIRLIVSELNSMGLELDLVSDEVESLLRRKCRRGSVKTLNRRGVDQGGL